MLFSPIFATLALVLSTLAVPLNELQERKELIVFNPKITSPQQNQLWIKGNSYNVTWKTDSIPPEKKNSTGLILLGYLENDSENLDIHNPLAVDFPIAQGWVTVKVYSDLPSRINYVVVLFGDSGNISPPFSIARAPPSVQPTDSTIS